MVNMLNVVSAILISLFGEGLSINQYNMFDHCDQLISMIREDVHAVLLYYEHESLVTDADFECTVEIWGYFDGGGLAMHFESFNMSNSKTYIEIRQGDSWDEGRPIQGLPYRLSSASTFNSLGQVYSSDWMDVFIRVGGEQPPYRKRIFDMAVNHFHTGACRDWEHKCDNGRCIDKTLKCNGYNPCGDHSDCQNNDGLSSGMIAVICVSTIAGATFIVLYTFYECCKCQRKKSQQQQMLSYTQSRLEQNEQPGTSPRNGNLSSYSRRRNNLNTDNIDVHPISAHYDDVTVAQHIDDVRDNRAAPPDYNTVMYRRNSVTETNLQPWAPRAPIEPGETSDSNTESNTESNTGPSAEFEPVRGDHNLPSYNDVLENEDAYNVTLFV